MTISTSWDDGNKLDLRLAKLLKKYNLPGTFFIPYTCDRAKINEERLSDNEIKRIAKMGFKIGGHTMTHPPDLKLLTNDELNDEIMGCKIWLEELLGDGYLVDEFCPPKGKYNEKVIKVVKESGFKNLRTVDVFNFPKDDDFVVKPTIHVYPDRKEYKGGYWMVEAIAKFDEAVKEDRDFHIWGHSWELASYSMFEELESFFKTITDDKKETFFNT